jgi:hypothetical protein
VTYICSFIHKDYQQLMVIIDLCRLLLLAATAASLYYRDVHKQVKALTTIV